jgi:POT family proton-dependent oligopeptide transporter
VICAVELYERLASVMVLSLLVLYLNECLGLDTGRAAKVASYVHMLSYVAGVLGGVLADRGLGARRAALWGTALLTFGYGAMGFAHSTPAGLWAAMAFIVAGHGLFKPNCTALVGALYSRSDPRRASAFVWFYYAINVGSMLGPCVGGFVRPSLGWGVTFRVAAVSIAASSVLLSLGKRYLIGSAAESVIVPKPTQATIPVEASAGPSSTRAVALALVLGVLAVFGAALSQSYGTLLLWARDDARLNLFGRAVPPDFFAALPAVFVLVFGPLLERFTKALTARGRTPSESGKFTAGMMLCAIAYALMLAASLVHRGPAPANPLWLVACNAALALGEILGLPVGLALSESLALPQSKGLTLGLSYGAHALGFWLGGEVSALWPLWTHARFFGALTAGCVLAAALIQSQAGRFARALAVKR